jgi:hypothetical protein
VGVLDEGGFTFCLAKIGSIGGNIMKLRTIIGIAAAAILPISTALADKYGDLVAKGYRWVSTDGPFACISKDDLQRIIKNRSDENTLRMVSQGGVYFRIRGAIVRVVQEDKALGLSQVHWDGNRRGSLDAQQVSKHAPNCQHIGDYRNPYTGNRGHQL